MPRFLRLNNTIIHIPSVSNVSMGTSCLGKPYLTVSYHTAKKVDTLCYGSWELCEAAFNTVKDAVKEIDTLLACVPLTTPEPVKEEVKDVPAKLEEVAKSEPVEQAS